MVLVYSVCEMSVTKAGKTHAHPTTAYKNTLYHICTPSNTVPNMLKYNNGSSDYLFEHSFVQQQTEMMPCKYKT